MRRTHFTCIIEGCSMPHKARGLCDRHYQQVKTNGVVSGNHSRSKKDKNEYIVDGSVARMMLYNVKAQIIGETIIDTEDVERCKPYSWSLDASGYVTGKVDGKNTRLGRFLLNLKKGDPECDHKNRIPLDHRKENLRPCNSSQNKVNRGPRKNSPTGYKGIIFSKGKWSARVSKGNRSIGVYGLNTPEEAAIKYNELAKQYHGEFAYQNEVRA